MTRMYNSSEMESKLSTDVITFKTNSVIVFNYLRTKAYNFLFPFYVFLLTLNSFDPNCGDKCVIGL